MSKSPDRFGGTLGGSEGRAGEISGEELLPAD